MLFEGDAHQLTAGVHAGLGKQLLQRCLDGALGDTQFAATLTTTASASCRA